MIKKSTFQCQKDNVDLFPTFSRSEQVPNFDSGNLDKVSDEHLKQQLSDHIVTIQGNKESDNLTITTEGRKKHKAVT